MAAKKPLSVDEILAACRKVDSSGSSSASKPAESEAPSVAQPSPVTPKAEAPPGPPSQAAASAGPKKDTKQISVAEMLAAARSEKSAAAKPSESKAKPTAATAPKPASKPVAPAESPMATTSARSKSPGPTIDTASILAAARKSPQAGPMSKAEAARQHKEAPKRAIAPVMPEKPAYAQAPPPTSESTTRRGFFSVLFGSFMAVGFTCLGVISAIWGLGLARFMFPNILTEPPSRFKVGFPTEFPPETVATKFIAQFGVWIVNTEYEGQRQITALKAVCTHLGCTPNWLEGEQKFKCPCHGSGFYIDGINFEGPAPRPLERYAIRVADDGQLEIDKSRKFQQEMGQWNSSASFVPV